MANYEKIEKIGEGTYGKVYKARDLRTGRFVAMKKTIVDESEGIPCTTLREISLLRNLSACIYIVRLLDVSTTKNKKGQRLVYLIFECLDCDLKKFMDISRLKGQTFTSKSIQSFLYQMLSGLYYCHRHGVLHRDLKPEKILLDANCGLVKLADFGLARAFSIPITAYTVQVMTLWYRAPEILLGDTTYSTAIDMWSIGCIFAEMKNLRPPFQGQSQIEQLLCIFRQLGTPNEHVWPGVTSMKNWHEYPQWKPKDWSLILDNPDPKCVDLLSKMLLYDPSKRISAKKAMLHPYFDDLDKSQY
eukprot:Gb_13850 [translate_table: standard]